MRKSRKGMKRNNKNFAWKAVSEYRPSVDDVMDDIKRFAKYYEVKHKTTDNYKLRYAYGVNAFCYNAYFEVCAIELFIQNTILSDGENFDADQLYECEQRQLRLIEGTMFLNSGMGWLENEDIAAYISDLYKRIKD